MTVVKRSGVSEPFSRAKVIDGLRKAGQGRPIDDDDLGKIAYRVEEKLRASGSAQIPAHEVGRAILEPLRGLDEVAYLRFASVYSNFNSLDDFEEAIARLRANEPPIDGETAAGPGEAGGIDSESEPGHSTDVPGSDTVAGTH